MLTRAQTLLAAFIAIAAITLLPVRAQDKPAAPAASNVGADSGGASGTYKWTVSGFGGNETQMTLNLKQDGDKLTGTISGFGPNPSDIQDGTIKDGKVSFKVVRDFGQMKSTTTYTATLGDGSMKGKSETVFTRDFEAKKEK